MGLKEPAQVGAQPPAGLGTGKVSVDSLGDRFQAEAPTAGFAAFLGRTRDPKRLLFLHYNNPHSPPTRFYLQL
jgi:hypothetical protein